MHPLFSDAPVTPPPPQIPQYSGVSELARALAGQVQPLYLPPANFGSIPLASMMQAAKDPGTGSNVTSATPDLAWNPNNPVGTDSLNPNTVNRGDAISNAWATYGGGFSQWPDSGPGSAVNPTLYQPTTDDQGLMQAMQKYGALAPQYQGAIPGQPTLGQPGVPLSSMLGAMQ